MSASIC